MIRDTTIGSKLLQATNDREQSKAQPSLGLHNTLIHGHLFQIQSTQQIVIIVTSRVLSRVRSFCHEHADAQAIDKMCIAVSVADLLTGV